MPPPPPEWLRRGLHKHQWAYQLSLVGGPPPGRKQQPEWFPWWKIYTCCMHVDVHDFMCVFVCMYVRMCVYVCWYVCWYVCVCGKQYIVVGLKNQSAIYTYLKTSTLFPDSAYSPSLSTNVSQLFLTRGAICNQVTFQMLYLRSVLPVTAKSSRQLYCYLTFDLPYHSYFACRKSRGECLPTPPPLLSFWLHQTLWSIPP